MQPEAEAGHQSRMEAIRLRNLARGTESPQSVQQVSVASSSQSPASHGPLPHLQATHTQSDAAQPIAASQIKGHTALVPNQHQGKKRRSRSKSRRGSASPALDPNRSSNRSSPAVSRLSREAARKQALSPGRSLSRHSAGRRKRAASPDDPHSAKRGQSAAEQSPEGQRSGGRGRRGQGPKLTAHTAFRKRERTRERARRASPTYSPIRGQRSRYCAHAAGDSAAPAAGLCRARTAWHALPWHSIAQYSMA